MNKDHDLNSSLKFGYFSSISLSIWTLITFGFAMIAIPPVGPYCPGDCMSYPYSDLLAYYPRDYYWIYLAIFQLFIFIIFMISNHALATSEKKIFSSISSAFGLMAATVLLIAYFTQFSVVPISVFKGETEGIALITQYNGHGLFIALEELGYISMSISLFFLAFVFSRKNRLEKAIQWILMAPLLVTALAFVYYSVKYGIDRDYRFEVATITINWLVLIVVGILISIHFKRKMNANSA
ncbi:MAG: hypothetical protein K9M55_03610 [Candidatus Marinimicrobia bacterium]|nr:hypothetical protein [Candidatus Neomarinimicrobiota bacterium]MCF7921766.1 hypothetical protein [Candidatus Neomarinimicrobiota bacterium]